MAAPMKIVLQNTFSYSRASVLCRYAVAKRQSHSKSNPEDAETSIRVPQVGMSADGRTLIGWHPEPEHPYEHTQPVQYDLNEAREGSVLKDEVIQDYMTRYRPSGPTVPELAALTHTTKHQWLPRREKKYRKRYTVKDRDGI